MLKRGTDLFLFQYASVIMQKLEMSCKRGTKGGQHDCRGARGMEGNSPVQTAFGFRVIWKCTQPHLKWNDSGVLVSISHGNSLNWTVFFEIRATNSNISVHVIVMSDRQPLRTKTKSLYKAYTSLKWELYLQQSHLRSIVHLLCSTSQKIINKINKKINPINK